MTLDAFAVWLAVLNKAQTTNRFITITLNGGGEITLRGQVVDIAVNEGILTLREPSAYETADPIPAELHFIRIDCIAAVSMSEGRR